MENENNKALIIEDYTDLIKVSRKLNSKEKEKRPKISMRNRLNIVLTIMVMLMPVFIYTMYILGKPEIKQFDKAQQVEYTGTVLNIELNKDTRMLNIEPQNLSIKLNDNTYVDITEEQMKGLVETPLNLVEAKYKENEQELSVSEKLSLYSVDCYNDYLYMCYYNDTMNGMRGFLVSSKTPNNIDYSKMKNKKEPGYFEYINEYDVAAYKYSFENMFMFLEDSIYDGKLGTVTLNERIKTIENKIRYNKVNSKNFQEEVTINLSGIGALKLSQIEGLKEAPGIYYNNSDNVVRLYNYEKDEALAFITFLNNTVFMCNAEELVQTNINNLLIHNGFNDVESLGYRTWFIMDDAMEQGFVIRVAAEASENTMVDILKQIGVNYTDIKVSTVQDMAEVQ